MLKTFRALPRSIQIICGLSLLIAVILLFDLIPFLRGGFGWQWNYDPAPLIRMIPLLVITIIYVIGTYFLLRAGKIRMLLAWAFLAAVIIPLAVTSLRTGDVVYELFTRVVSGLATGPHLAAAEIDWSGSAWLNWPQVMSSFDGRSVHVALAPPGLPIFYHVLNTAIGAFPGLADALHRWLMPYQCYNYNLLAYTSAEWASAIFGMLMPLWAALTVFPLYGVARRFAGSSAAALVAIWWPLIPALSIFAPTWNTIYPLIALLAFWCLIKGLANRIGWMIAAGLLSGLLTFANFSLVPLLGFFGLYALLTLNWRRLLLPGLCFTFSFILPWLVFWLASGITPLDMLQTAMSQHLSLDRPYLPWLWLHSWEWFVFTGLPLLLLWILGAAKPGEGGAKVGRALLLALFIVVISGTARGETGRVWLFFAPFALIAAAIKLQNLVPSRPIWLLITSVQAVLLLVLAICWPGVSASDMTPPPPVPPLVAASRPADAAFGQSLHLVNWDTTVDGDAIILRLNWEAQEQMTIPYWFSALLVTPAGTPASESVVWQPQATHYPTTCWAAGQVVSDSIRLLLPDDAPTGDWWISLAVFGDVDHPDQRLAVTLPDGTTDSQIGLGPTVLP